jgi:hypothetical protein
MIKQGSGVILALNSGSAHGSPMMGSTGPADARSTPISATSRPRSARTRARASHLGVPETPSPEKLAAVNNGMQLDEAAFQGLLRQLDQMRMLQLTGRAGHRGQHGPAFRRGRPGLGTGRDWNSFIFFSDPDGNAWTVQERPAGNPGAALGGSPRRKRI